MHKFPALLFFIIIASALSESVSAQVADSAVFRPRILPENVIEDYASDARFTYIDIVEEPGFWNKIKAYLLRNLLKLLQTKESELFFKISAWAIIIISFFALLNQLFRGNLGGFLFGETAKRGASPEVSIDTMPEVDLQKMLTEYIEHREFENAAKILYQITLKKLKQQNLIVWKQDKTNHEYERELRNHETASAFRSLTRYYEYVEFGKFYLGQKEFDSMHSIFREFEQKLLSR